MKQNDGTDEEAPDQELPATREEQDRGQEQGDQDVEPVQETELRIASEVRHLREVGAEISVGRDPSHMAPPEAVLAWGVHILLGVGVPVMAAMVGGPPEGPALYRCVSQDGEDELGGPGGVEGEVLEVAVVEPG